MGGDAPRLAACLKTLKGTRALPDLASLFSCAVFRDIVPSLWSEGNAPRGPSGRVGRFFARGLCPGAAWLRDRENKRSRDQVWRAVARVK